MKSLDFSGKNKQNKDNLRTTTGIDCDDADTDVSTLTFIFKTDMRV